MNSELSKYNGIIPALVTPYTKDGLVNEKSLRKLVSLNIEKGVKGFYVCGSTAEVFMLKTEERKQILEIVADENNKRVTLISHVGSISTDESIELAKHAKSIGVDAISSVPPFYYGFRENEIIEHYISIVETVDMPFILYNFPANSGFTITPGLVNKLRSTNGNFIGLKHTSMNLFDMQQMLEIDNFIVLAGRDEVFAGALAMGAQGAIGSTFNLMPEIYIDIIKAVKCGDYTNAKELQKKANKFINYMTGGTGLPELKFALGLIGIECNGCRKPIIDISSTKKNQIKKTLQEIEVI